MSCFKSLCYTLKFILLHPLNRQNRLGAVISWLKWQVGSRLVPGAVVVDLVNDVKMIVEPGMTGATGNVYTGLHEFEDMSFVLHCLRAGDLFVDVGANIGSYTLLAAGATGARCMAVEPILSTFKHLRNNVAINNLHQLVTVFNLAVGNTEGTIKFTTGLDTENHVVGVTDDNMQEALEVEVTTLDKIIGDSKPLLIKIDVEGFESNVIAGAHDTFADSSLQAVLIELNGLGMRYGFNDMHIHNKLLEYGFRSWSYDPFSRSLMASQAEQVMKTSGNTLYIRNNEFIAERLRTAPHFKVHHHLI